MIIKINDDREFEIKTLYSGYLEENKSITLEFEFPEYLEKYNKKANFELKDGTKVCKLFDEITSNKLTLTRDLLKFNKLQMAIEFFDTDENLIYRTSILTIIISDSIICDDDVSEDDPKVVILDELIQKVNELNTEITENEATRESNEQTRISNEETRVANETAREEYVTQLKKDKELGNLDGATFTPQVNENGDLSWSNNKGLVNPQTINIRGPEGKEGKKGEQGEPFRISKTYPSVEVMQSDFENMPIDSYVMIATSIEIEDNAKLYYRAETEWVYITDFSGAIGIQGPKGDDGDTGAKGEQGEPGVGISKLEVIDGALYVTLTNNVKENAGLILTDEVKSWLVSQITDNAESEFNTYYDSKVEEFNTNATEKTTAYNDNAEDKLNEYNTNATNKINEYNTNAEAILKILPKTETEVLEEIDIDDAGESSFNKLSVFGNSRQASTEGYNLFDYLNNIRNTSGNNITVEKDDKMGYIIVNGTPNVNYAIIVSNLNITDLIEDKQTYTLKQENANNLSINYIYSQIIIENKETLQKQYIDTRTTFKQTFTVDKTTYNYYANIQTGTIENTGTLNNFKTRFMIYKGTEEKSYEPYTGGKPSPNPDYPQEIESIKDSITFKRIGKNYFNSEIEMGGYTAGGTKYASNTRIRSVNSFILKPDTYTISCPTATAIAINSAYGNKEQAIYDNNVLTITLEEEQDCVLTVETPDLLNAEIQIEKGTVATEYEPYHEDVYTLPIQQEMLEGDMFEKIDGNWYEVHKRKKNSLIGDNEFNINLVGEEENYITFAVFTSNVVDYKQNEYLLSNYFIYKADATSTETLKVGNGITYVKIKKSNLSEPSINGFKSWLAEKNEEGNPLIYYFGISKFLKLPCTPEQTAVLNQLEQFYLEKGINHIYSDDELSPKFKLKYYQDMNILLDKINKNIADVSAEII